MKLLIIEDEKELKKSIVHYLSEEGYVCEAAADYPQALNMIQAGPYDCFVVDIMIPNGEGLELVKEIKSRNADSGIVLVSAKNSLEDKVAGMEYGADDYILKPFHLSELNARIQSVIRRRNLLGNNEIRFHEIRIVPDMRRVFVNETEVRLTAKEYDLLIFFISNKGRVIPKHSLAEHLWGDYMDEANTYDFLNSHISNLRKKLTEAGARDYTRTVYGIGYKFSS